jgi:N-dimethylarginine dimethylaminohydrolase
MVMDANDSRPQILMCPPDHYGIEYEINAWMSRERQADQRIAMEQWTALYQTLVHLGVHVSLVEPVEGLPDLVFTANAAMMYRGEAILSRFRHPQRQGEEPHFEKWFQAHGITVKKLQPDQYFEGAGDALFAGDTLVAGYLTRSDARSQQVVGEIVDCRVIPLELVDGHYYHLDTCFCPLSPTEAIYFPGAFDEYGRHALKEIVPELIPVDDEEARSFACNAVVVGRTVITNVGCPKLHADLKVRGFTPIETPLGEFVKAGGSAKCLTLRLDGEEGAAWKRGG